MATDTEIKQFILNVLGKEQYEEAKESGSINPTELYFVDDDQSNSAALPPLTFTGAVEATYDGSTPVTVEIPMGGGGSENLNVRLVASVTIDPANPPESIIIDRDNDGNPFELKRAIIFTDISSDVSYAQFVVNGAPWTYALKFNNTDGMIYAEFHDSIMFAISTFQGLRANILGYKTSHGIVANKAEYFGLARSFEILAAQGYSKGTFVHIFEVL